MFDHDPHSIGVIPLDPHHSEGLHFGGTGASVSDTSVWHNSVTASPTGEAGVGKLVTALSYVAGLGFAVADLLKVTFHHDRPHE
jgi:hypothetical protein